MFKSNQIFAFGKPIKDLLTACATDIIYLFWKDNNQQFLGINETEAALIKAKTGYQHIVGKSNYDLIPSKDVSTITANDLEIRINGDTKFFIEPVYGREFLSFKTPLKNSGNNNIGTLGISFCFSEITLARVINIINQLIYIPQQINNVMYHSIIKSSLPISVRQKECVYYLLKGMSYKEISQVLNISPRTVETHMKNIKHTLRCYSRSDIISKVLEAGHLS